MWGGRENTICLYSSPLSHSLEYTHTQKGHHSAFAKSLAETGHTHTMNKHKKVYTHTKNQRVGLTNHAIDSTNQCYNDPMEDSPQYTRALCAEKATING